MAENKTATPKKTAKTTAKTAAKKPVKRTTRKTSAKKTAKKPVISESSKKKARISREVTRLTKLFGEIPDNKKKLVNASIKDVAFLTIAMEDLREEMAVSGLIDEYKNGPDQYGKKQSTALQSYLQCSNKLTAAMKLLNEQLPKAEPKKPDTDDFDEFVYSRPEL